MTKLKFVAKAAIINDQQQILVLKRSSTDPMRPGGTDIPGGGIEANESPLEAVIREAYEEANITLEAQATKLVRTSTTDYTEPEPYTVIRYLFVGYSAGQAVSLSHEHEAYEWLSIDAALDHLRENHWGGLIALAYAQGHISLN